ncbi:phenolic acid decarboxylase [Demequina maris]|uniref:phenolic acid decarboxylase n=1 Tax=Demequina maris TaxID=1638982 RepID=UPI0007808CBB|nr:phenolic acid decarboxylase [Demequina maris]
MSATSIVGHRFLYTYDNGWTYELYVKNATTIDYRIHSGMVGGRWVKDQTVDLAEIAPGVHKISWTEPTGTSVVVTFVPEAGSIHGTIFFPRWVHEHPERTVLFQNDHIDRMLAYRAEGPIYPLHVVVEGATILRIDEVGADDDSVIACAPSELPADFLAAPVPA